MIKKNIEFGHEARVKLLNGMNKITDSVAITLGPKGRNVIIEKNDGLRIVITKDGVTVAREIELKDSLENIGCQIIKESAIKTSDDAGDGTTTATILARSIVEKGMKNVTAGANPMDLKRGIDNAVQMVVKSLEKQTIEVGTNYDKINQVATISANNDKEIGDMITEAIRKVGFTGVITIDEARGMETTMDIVNGMKLDRGYISPYFITNPDKMEVVLEDCFILIHEEKISSITTLVPILEEVRKTGKPLLIIADTLETEVLGALVYNKIKNTIRVASIKSPGFGDRRKDLLDDIAIVTGGDLVSITKGNKLEDVKLDSLGVAEKVIISKDTTIIIGGKGDTELIKNRVNQIREQIKNKQNDYDQQKNEARLANLTGGVGIINVGAASEIELKEKKDRFDDALHATRAAIEEGIVPGGGIAYIRCIESLNDVKYNNEDEKTGINIIRKVLEEPLRIIIKNAGGEPSVILNEVKNGFNDYGYDARNEKFGSMIEMGIVDPKKVSRVALENAASIAGLFLTTECVISEIHDKKEIEEIDM